VSDAETIGDRAAARSPLPISDADAYVGFMSRSILIVEDDAETRDFIASGFRQAGFSVDVAEDGKAGLAGALDGGRDLLVLDRMLPGLDGLALLKALRAAGVGTPAIMLSALGAVDERVRGLRAGADDYLPKPFSFEELHARAEALLRRPTEQAAETVLRCADLTMDLIARKVERAGRPIVLQPREFQLLEYLLRRQGRVVTRTMLLEGLWGYHFDPQTNVIDVHVSRLRRKLEQDGPADAPSLIRTVRGAGYVLDAPQVGG
jgi:two-component system OmpR family response regulator